MSDLRPIHGDAAYNANTATENGSSICFFPSEVQDRFLRLYDTVFPVNIATNEREFGYLPKSTRETLERNVDHLYKNLYAYRYYDREMEHRVQKIFDAILLHVPNIQIKKPLILNLEKLTAQHPGITKILPLEAITLFGGRIVLSKERIESMDFWHYPPEQVTTQDVLAFALAREIAHALIDHPSKRLVRTVPGNIKFFLLIGLIAYWTGIPIVNGIKFFSLLFPFWVFFSVINKMMVYQNAEREADEYGIELMHRAGYNMRGSLIFHIAVNHAITNNRMIRTWEKHMLNKSFVSYYPSFQSRISACAKKIKEIKSREIASEKQYSV